MTSKEEFMAKTIAWMKRDLGPSDSCDFEARAEEKWGARVRVVEWLEQPMPTRCALIWRLDDAPDVLKTWDLASQDDIDYIGLFPPNSYHHYAEEGSGYGCCRVDEVGLPNGWAIRYGYHS